MLRLLSMRGPVGAQHRAPGSLGALISHEDRGRVFLGAGLSKLLFCFTITVLGQAAG